MKKVLIFSLNYYPRFIGGAEVAIKEITDRIPAEDIEFHLVALRVDSNLPLEEKIGNVTVHRIGPSRPNPTIADLKKWPLHILKHWYQFGAFFAALSLHRKYRFDGMWAMMAHSTGIPAGLFKTFHPEVKYLLTLQEGDPPAHIERLARPVWPLFKRGFTKADALQPISNFLLAWGRRMGFKGESKVIPNAVDTKRFAQEYSVEEITGMKEKLGKKPEDIFVVTTSRLVHKNGVDDMIRALALLPENISFLIYGIGPDEQMLKALAKKLGVDTRARFMGQIGHGEMPLMLKSCDIFIRASRSEGMGNSFVEAMAAELPVIATQEGGIADFLFDEKRNPDKQTTGWAVDADSPEQIAEAVKEIVSKPEKVARVLPVAKALAFEKYDWDLIARDMRHLFDGLLKSR
jgi:glycosyltransferase involved in cell wall biosynthesis